MLLVVGRLAIAPIGLPLAGFVEDAVRERTGLALSVGRVEVRVALARLDVVLSDLRLEGDRAAGSVGRLTVSQFLSGRTVAIRDASLKVDPSGEGGALLLPAPGEAIAGFDAALGAVTDALKAAGIGGVTLAGSRIDLLSAGRPITEARVFQDVRASVTLDDAFLASVAAVGAGGPITARLTRSVRDGSHALELTADGIVPRDLGPAPFVQDGFDLGATVSAVVRASGPVLAEAVLHVGDGTVILGNDPARTLQEGEVSLALAQDGRTIEVRPSRFAAGNSVVTVAGTIAPGVAAADPWTFHLEAPGAQLHSQDIDKTPVVLDTAVAEGRIDFAKRLVKVDLFNAMAAGGRADAVLTFDFSENGPQFSGAAHIGPSTIDTLLGTWPAVIAYNPRLAIASTILGGIVRSGDVEIAFTPLEIDPDASTNSGMEGILAVDLEFVDTTITVPDMPLAITRALGSLRMRDRVLSVRLDGGVISAGEHGALQVTDGAFTIPELGAEPAEANLTATVEGPLSAVVALGETLDLPQLKEAALEPVDVTGTVRATLAMWTPLLPDLAMDDRRWSIDATLSDAGSTVSIGGRTFSNADIELSVNQRRLAARGTAAVDGLTIDVNYSEVFAEGKSGAARFVLTDEDRRARGFDVGEALTGPVVVTVEADQADRKSFVASLTEASIAIPGFNKPAGTAMTARGTFEAEGDNLTINDLKVEGGGLRVAGSLSVAAGRLQRAELTDLALSRGDRARLTVTSRGEGYDVTAEASAFDARRLVAALGSSGGREGARGAASKRPPIRISATGERLRLKADTYATDVAFTATHTGTLLQSLTASGRIDGVNVGAFAAKLAPAANGARELHAEVTELGRALAAFDVYERMRGGRTLLDAQLAPDGSMVGRLTVADFALSDERTLEVIIERTRRDGTRSGSPTRNRERNPAPLAFQATDSQSAGLGFDQLSVDFEKNAGTVTVREAILRGPVLGGTANGTVDLGSKTMRLNGTLIPAYGLNNLFGRVPLVGQILGGGDDGGLIGVTFRLAGALGSPQVIVNPLSAVAPGIFRRIFEFR